jgi:nucleoside 2-deoxyribosyltransferase
MKIYLAASFIRYQELRGYAAELRIAGHTVTSRWLEDNHQMNDNTNPSQAAQFGLEDWADVKAADCVIVFTDPPRESTSRGGRHVEFGIALEAGKALVLIGDPENVFQWLPQVHRFQDFNDILERLS